MNISEMHIWFRQYAQQMGMQNVRAILPEQIDILINTSISDTVNELIRTNVGITNDRIITDNSKIGQINALRTLYKVKEVTIDISDIETKSDNNFHLYSKGSRIGRFTTKSFEGLIPNMLYLVDLSIDYTYQLAEGDKTYTTTYFPIRLIDDTYLADTLNDFVLKPRVRTPIAVLYNDTLDIYLGESYVSANGLSSNTSLTPNNVRIAYLAKPAQVAYLYDVGGENIDCDLPEAMHIDILKHAVDLYRVSISGNTYAAQQQQQNQTRENARNIAAPSSDTNS